MKTKWKNQDRYPVKRPPVICFFQPDHTDPASQIVSRKFLLHKYGFSAIIKFRKVSDNAGRYGFRGTHRFAEAGVCMDGGRALPEAVL
jgi:hypothetical protein